MPRPVDLTPGACVRYHGAVYQITRVVNLDQVLARDGNGRTSVLPVAELGADEEPPDLLSGGAGPSASAKEGAGRDLAEIDDARWAVALARDRLIAPLRVLPARTRAHVEAAAAAVTPADARAATGGRSDAIDAATLYRWLQAYQRTGTVSSLVPRFDARGHRGSHLTPDVDAVVSDVLDRLPREHAARGDPPPTVEDVHAAVRAACDGANLRAPHLNTVRARAQAHADALRLRRRRATRGAPPGGQFPGADAPLSVVQIDHTPLDLECVSDDEHRANVGRPWLTVAVDVFSRVVLGWVLGLDPPSAHRVGLCLAQAILPKEAWLAARGLTTRWPVWGRPVRVHVDNAKEFRGEFLTRVCEEYGIGLEWRPVAQPTYGAHVERLLGVVLREVHKLPGTTFSNPTARGDYDSRRHAALTVAEAERVLMRWVTGVYHDRAHAGLGGDTPLGRWEAGCLRGVGGLPPTGLPLRETDERRLTLDFLPYVERTVQPDGVHLHNVRYYSDVLRDFMRTGSKGPKYLFRYDVRDASRLHFRHPTDRTYYDVPYADTRHPRVSGYELDAAARVLREEGRAVDEAAIFKQSNCSGPTVPRA